MMKMSKFVVIGAALLLSFTFFLPVWYILLEAPQYPEGLGLCIYVDTITGASQGDLNKINNLNHYIGMKRIEPDAIPELAIIPWVIPGLMVFGIAAGISGRRKILLIWLIVFALVAAAGFVDYYLWGYDYGHNLDSENAIIKIPGMSYQPPLIGSKQLLNFRATSLPGPGGWLAIISFVIGLWIWTFEFIRNKRKIA